jgi:UDP-N-acetylglucosamine/UDP-N-acetylgalactosamine diphosphorylase
MPSLAAADGRVLLAARDSVAMSPDGHGGSIKALAASGAIDDMLGRGIAHISYFQVDNPLVKVLDPLFIGLHVGAEDSSGEMSSKMVPKAAPEERVGVFCRSAGKNIVVEYSDLPESLAREVDDAGRLRYCAGSIAIHLIGVGFVQRLTTAEGGFALPYHRALKAVRHVDPETGGMIEPAEPNAVKLETFVFDALRFAESSIVCETGRTEEFAPIKNSAGVDSPQTSHALQSDRHGAWLEARGVEIPRAADGHVAARIEISPLTAIEAADLDPAALPPVVKAGDEIVL